MVPEPGACVSGPAGHAPQQPSTEGGAAALDGPAAQHPAADPTGTQAVSQQVSPLTCSIFGTYAHIRSAAAAAALPDIMLCAPCPDRAVPVNYISPGQAPCQMTWHQMMHGLHRRACGAQPV